MSSTLEKVGGQVLEFGAAELESLEPTILTTFDKAVENGATSAEEALTVAVKAHSGVMGALLGGEAATLLKTSVDGLVHEGEGAAKAALDAFIVTVRAEAAKLEA